MPDIFDTITIPKKDIFDRISLPHKKDIFDTLGTPIPQPLPEPTEQERIAKEQFKPFGDVLVEEGTKSALNLGRKTFEPFVAMPYQASKAITDPIAEAIQQRTLASARRIPSQIQSNLVDLTLGAGEYQAKPLGTADIANMLTESARQAPMIEDPYRRGAPQIEANRTIQDPYSKVNIDASFPQFRESWTTDPYSSALAISPIVAPLIFRGAQEISARIPKKEPVISQEVKDAASRAVKEIGQIDKGNLETSITVANLRNQIVSAYRKNDINTINSIVADFREGQTIPTAQQPKPTLNIPEINATTLREKQAKALARQKNIIQPTPEYNAEMAKILQDSGEAVEFPFGENIKNVPRDLLEASQPAPNIFKQIKEITSIVKIDKSFLDHFDKSEIRPIAQKSVGLFSTKNGMPLDEVADGLGITTDELADKMRNAISGKEAKIKAQEEVSRYILEEPQQPLPKPENVEIVKPQPKGFTPIEASPVVSKVGEELKPKLDLPIGQKIQATVTSPIYGMEEGDIGTIAKVTPKGYEINWEKGGGSKELYAGIKPILQQTHTMPSGEVMPGAEHKETSKFSQPKMFEGEKTNIVPKMEAEIQGQQKLFQPKTGQLTPEQLQQQTSAINIGREGAPSIKSDAEIRYAPGTGINLETLDLPPDIKHTVYKLTQQYQPHFEDIRNRKTWEEINKEAESLGFDSNQLLERQKGEAYNAAKLKATKDIQNNTALEAKRIADEAVKLALDAKLTAEQQAEVLAIANMKMKKAAAILAQAGGAYSEAGRALNILRQVTSATKAQKNWNAILDALGGREMTLEMFKRISGMDTADTPQVAKFIREVQKARTADMVLEAWRNAILSGTKTLVTNPLSNAITFASHPIETGIAATLEKGKSLITGKKSQVYFREVPAEIVGAINGIWNGARVFLNTMKTEIPTFGETKIETAIMQTNIPGKLGRVIRTPQTILMAQDDAMKAVIYDSTMKTLATRLAIRKGLKGKKEIVDFVGNLLTNPQGKNKRLFDLFDKRARAEADYRTYNKALGKIGQILMRLREQEFPKGSGIKPLYYIMPFMRTPTNIVKYGLERTPFNFARLGYKNYKGEIPSAQLSEEFAKPIVGTIMFLWGWLIYEYGYMTGDAPKDKNDRATWYNAGKKPYSFYIPWLNRYISYQRIEPLGSIFGMVADFFENIDRGVANTKEAFTKILLSITRNWTNKTFIMGATNAINAYTDPERYGDRFVDGLTSSLVPNIISSFNSDPYYREKQTFLDSIKAKVPGLSETLPPKRDILGSPAKRGETKGMALFNQVLPFGVIKPSDDPVRKELLRLNDSIGFSVGMPNKYFRRGKEKIDISADVYDAYSKESGELAYKLISRIIKGSGYEKLNDETKASLIRKQFDVARDYIRPKYINQLKAASSNR